MTVLMMLSVLQGFSPSMVNSIVEFYPHVVNQVEDLERFIIHRVPPASKTDANAGIMDSEELLEQFANIQVIGTNAQILRDGGSLRVLNSALLFVFREFCKYSF